MNIRFQENILVDKLKLNCVKTDHSRVYINSLMLIINHHSILCLIELLITIIIMQKLKKMSVQNVR